MQVENVRTVSAYSVDLPVVSFEIGRFGRADDYVLHIPPRQVTIGLQSQGTDPGRQRSGRRCSRVAGRARMM